MIIGITGPIASGKKTATTYLTEKGFIHVSTKTMLKEELESRKQPITKKNIETLQLDLENRFGKAHLVERALNNYNEKKHYIITGIYNQEEIELLKKKQEFHLIYIETEKKIRLKRIKKRTLTENNSLNIKKQANIIIKNEKTKNILHKALDKALYHCKNKRPSWDDYFIGIMMAVRERGTCDRGKSGSIIVKNNRILATGYVGSAAGMNHCDEVGHLMHEVINEDGTTSKHCIRTVHAEQNAMIQAARNGVAIEGATLYCSMTPCFICAKLIINAGIKRVVANKDYHKSKLSKAFFTAAKVKLEIRHKEIETYSNMQGKKK